MATEWQRMKLGEAAAPCRRRSGGKLSREGGAVLRVNTNPELQALTTPAEGDTGHEEASTDQVEASLQLSV